MRRPAVWLIIAAALLGLLLVGCLPAARATPTAAAPPPATSAPLSGPAASPTAGAAPPASTALVSAPPPAATPSAPAAPSALAIARPPDRDVLDLARRLRPGPLTLATPRAAPSYRVGDRHTFWLVDQETRRVYQTVARLAYIGDHLYMYLEDGVDAPLDRVKASADIFDRQSYPTLRRYFGSEWTPGIDNDARLTVLNARVKGVGGYFSSGDEYPRSVNQYSNEREMFVVNVDSYRPGTAGYDATLAHEFTHMIQFNVMQGGESWIAEGSAVLGEQAAGQPNTGTARLFLNAPDVQLTEWAAEPAAAAPHYGAAYLFLDYFAGRYGGFAAVGQLLAHDGRGQGSFDAYLKGRGLGLTFDDVFRDWVVANYLDDRAVAGGRYGYDEPGLSVKPRPVTAYPARLSATVHQYGADYYELQQARGDVTISFAGQRTTPLVDNDPHGGRAAWWSNRGDQIDSRLTRPVDLSGLRQATLQFWIWYDVEESYDYGYVEASTDGGRTWQTLPGAHTTASNPNGANYGHGYTGTSGAGERAQWVQEQVDLTPYAGSRILLRFEYVTDDSYNASGFGLDDVAIPELGFHDDAESDNGWVAEGFVRTDNRVAQRYAVQVVARGKATTVQDLPLDADNRGQLVVRGVGPGGDAQSLVVVVAGLTPLTTRTSPYDLTVSVGRP